MIFCGVFFACLLFFFFLYIGYFNKDHIVFLTETSLAVRDVVCIIGAKKLNLHEIFLVFYLLY